MPGKLTFLDMDDDDDSMPSWDSDETGISVQLVDGRAVAITAFDECIWDGIDLIGRPIDEVIAQCGGLTEPTDGRDDEYQLWETRSGAQLISYDGKVTAVGIHDYADVSGHPGYRSGHLVTCVRLHEKQRGSRPLREFGGATTTLRARIAW
jgi:hypothetical protein